MPKVLDPPPPKAVPRPRPVAVPAPRPAIAASPAKLPAAPGRVVLEGITWDLYQTLRNLPENWNKKFTYDGPAGGLLEIEMPGFTHGSVAGVIGLLISIFAEERQTAVRSTEDVTLSREDLDRGLEGDKSFYISSFEAVRGRENLNLSAGDPPPDLSVEVDVTHPGVNKLPIYAALGTPEVWVWANDAIAVRRRTDAGTYEVVPESVELPGFPFALAADLIARRADAPQYELLAEFRAALRGDDSSADA